MTRDDPKKGQAQSSHSAFPQLPEWQKDQVMADLRRTYVYARSAAQRALERAAEGPHENMDAIVETVWWISVCDSYMWTVLGEHWRCY